MNILSKNETVDINKLDEIVANSKDAVEFYKSAKEKAEDQELKAIFDQLASTHQGTLHRIESLIRKKDETRSPNDVKGTFAGQSNKLFGELLAFISSKPDRKLIERLEEAEDRCLHSLQEATKMNEFDSNERQILEQELMTVKNSHGNMKYLKQTYAA